MTESVNTNIKILDKISSKNVLDYVNSCDLICDCTDNFQSRYLINDACVLANKPLFYGSIFQFEGQASVFNLNSNSPNYRDLVPEPPPLEFAPSCSEAGVFGVLPGIIGLIQATEVIKVILGIGTSLDGILLIFNALDMTFDRFPIHKDADIPSVTSIEEVSIPTCPIDQIYNLYLIQEMSILDFYNQYYVKNHPSTYSLIDVRTEEEYSIDSLPDSINIPIDIIDDPESLKSLLRISSTNNIFVYCKSGIRSSRASKILSSHNIKTCVLTGGFDLWLNSKP